MARGLLCDFTLSKILVKYAGALERVISGVVIQDRFAYNKQRLNSRICEESDIILS